MKLFRGCLTYFSLDAAPKVHSHTHTIPTITPHTLLRGERVAATNALVINEGRGQAGLAAAEVLLRNGARVEIITSDIAVANDVDPTNRSAWYTRLGEQGCVFTATQIVESVEARRVRCRNVYDRRISYRDNIDLIVNWQGCRANNEFDHLAGSDGDKVHFVGDYVTPRTVEMAIAEAEKLANEL